MAKIDIGKLKLDELNVLKDQIEVRRGQILSKQKAEATKKAMSVGKRKEIRLALASLLERYKALDNSKGEITYLVPVTVRMSVEKSYHSLIEYLDDYGSDCYLGDMFEFSFDRSVESSDFPAEVRDALNRLLESNDDYYAHEWLDLFPELHKAVTGFQDDLEEFAKKTEGLVDDLDLSYEELAKE